MASSSDDGYEVESTNFKQIFSEARNQIEDDNTQNINPQYDECPEMNPAETIAEVKARKKQKRGKEMIKYNWSINAVEAVIEEWENRPLLFDCSHPQYQ